MPSTVLPLGGLRALARAGVLFAPLLALGCAQNPLVMQGQLESMRQQQLAQAERYRELESRITTLDQDNQELESLVAQERQLKRILEDQVAAMRDQLKSASSQLAQLDSERGDGFRKAPAMAASSKLSKPVADLERRTTDQLVKIDLAGIEARADGDVIRIELPGNKLFEPGGARLLPQAGGWLAQVSGEIDRAYPGRIVGVEGHTDSDPIRSGRWTSNHQLSVAQAMAVYDYLSTRGGLKADRLFVVGHGSNHPVVSNGTIAGKERNRRVELVVYPERPSGQ